LTGGNGASGGGSGNFTSGAGGSVGSAGRVTVGTDGGVTSVGAGADGASAVVAGGGGAAETFDEIRGRCAREIVATTWRALGFTFAIRGGLWLRATATFFTAAGEGRAAA